MLKYAEIEKKSTNFSYIDYIFTYWHQFNHSVYL